MLTAKRRKLEERERERERETGIIDKLLHKKAKAA